ncbi:MAG: undecaprenyldiphospho-muramoylpentapeptide beta-N-acetylglucosaminyltransferase [Spirochaetaceae bacterium]|nr:MAG: undecaprenyldiphospho-muramoylpentapeptide beta-N-acetylglucosaminyltransferase [Spirochaetaceae bacterium]
MRSIVFTGGGTGGHVYPALAVHAALSEDLRRRVLWIGSRKGVERTILRGSGIPYRAIPTGKLRRYLDLENGRDIFRVGAGILAALRVLRHVDAAIVFSKGGFVAVPVVVAAWILGIPVVIHESDSDPGLATRLTAPMARRICVPYSDTARAFTPAQRRRILVTGNPVRKEFFSAAPGDALARLGIRDEGQPVLLVSGGSLGAQQLNDFVLEELAVLLDVCTLVHQTGPAGAAIIPEISRRAEQLTRAEATRSGTPPARRYAAAPLWTEEFPPLLRRADLVVCRAGAGTIWELAVTGTPAILVPLSRGASRGDQIRNARRYADTGAALVPPDSPADLAGAVRSLLLDRDRLRAMGVAARAFADGDSAVTIAGVIAAIYNESDQGRKGESVRS